MPLGMMDAAGSSSFLLSGGPNPFNAAFSTPGAMLNPVLKMAVEFSTGRKIYSGAQFTDPNVVTPFGSDQQYRVSIGPDGQPIANPVERVSPAPLEMLLQNFPQYQSVKTLAAGSKPYDTTSLLSILAGEGVKMDPATGKPVNPVEAATVLGKYFGVSVMPYNIQQYQTQRAEEEAAAIKAWLKLHPQP